MTEELKPEEIQGEAPASEEVREDRAIVNELEKLGKQLIGAAKAAWESEERRKLQDEIATGIQKIGQELGVTLEKASESEQVQEIRTRAGKVATDIQQTDVVDEVRKGLLVGLEAINRELSKLLDRLETKPAPVEAVEDVVEAVEDAAEKAADAIKEEVADVVETLTPPDVPLDEETRSA